MSLGSTPSQLAGGECFAQPLLLFIPPLMAKKGSALPPKNKMMKTDLDE